MNEYVWWLEGLGEEEKRQLTMKDRPKERGEA